MRNLFLVLIVLFAAGCTTTDQKNEERWEKLPDDFPIPPKKSTAIEKTTKTPLIIDFDGLQRRLGMVRPHHSLGYREKEFNTCNVGSGYSSSDDCHNEHFVVIHFQLQCRDTDGTVSNVVTAADTQPIANQTIKWNLGTLAGLTKTDREGFGQIRTTATFSQKESRLRLTSSGDFLYLRAGEISRVVAPKQWCR